VRCFNWRRSKSHGDQHYWHRFHSHVDVYEWDSFYIGRGWNRVEAKRL